MAKRSVKDFTNLLFSLFPRGAIWNRILDSRLGEILTGYATEFSRIDNRGSDLLSERSTLTTVELLPEHEYDLGLPDNCTPDGLTDDERRITANVKLTLRGALNPQHYIDVAARYGYTAVVVQYGEGDPEVDNIFKWKFIIDISDEEVVAFRAGSGRCGDRLLTFSELVEAVGCYVQTYKPAHTLVINEASGIEFGRGFDRSFNSLPSFSDGYLQGAFSKAFGLGFDVYYGGGFDFHEFSNDFDKPR